MAKNINMPRLGLTMTEGTVVKWLKGEGEKIEIGEEIVEIESDKAVVSFESPEAGTILKILVKEGEKGEIYKPIAIVGQEGEKIEERDNYDEKIDAKEEQFFEQNKEGDNRTALIKSEQVEQTFISPSAKRVARENNIEIGLIPLPRGKSRIEKNDVLAFLQNNRVKSTPLASQIAKGNDINLNAISKGPNERIFSKDIVDHVKKNTQTEIMGEVIPVVGMRKIIATRMKNSIEVAAHVSLTTEVDMTNLNDFRNRTKSKVLKRYDTKISVNDIIVKCTAVALKESPRVNSVYTDNEIIEKSEVNIGVAVALPEGLVVPVIKNANILNVGEISNLSKSLIEKARQGKLHPDEISGGTFTVSNLGMYEITQFTSIINQPESAILSVGKIVERPVVVDSKIEIRPIMNLTISFDHRPIDGSVAAIFLKRVKALLEEPYELVI